MSKTCQSCGKILDDQTKFCDGCGAGQIAADPNTANQQNGQNQSGQQAPGANQAKVFTTEDIEKNKTVAALAYLIFFLPLIVCPESKYGRFHANQGLLLAIVGFAGGFILSMIPILGWILLPFFYIALAVFFVIGLMNGFKGIAKPLPIFGKFEIIK